MRLTTEVQPLAEETEGADRRSPVALGARRGGASQQVHQRPSSFRGWLRVCFPCAFYSLVKPQGLWKSPSHQVSCLLFCAWAVHFHRTGPQEGCPLPISCTGTCTCARARTRTHKWEEGEQAKVCPQVTTGRHRQASSMKAQRALSRVGTVPWATLSGEPTVLPVGRAQSPLLAAGQGQSSLSS